MSLFPRASSTSPGTDETRKAARQVWRQLRHDVANDVGDGAAIRLHMNSVIGLAQPLEPLDLIPRPAP